MPHALSALSEFAEDIKDNNVHVPPAGSRGSFSLLGA